MSVPIVTVFDRDGSDTALVEEFPDRIQALDLHLLPIAPFQSRELLNATVSDLAESYCMKLSKHEMALAADHLDRLYQRELGGAVRFSLEDLLRFLSDRYWKNPFDRSEALRRTTCTTIEGILKRCPSLGVARGADPVRDLFSRNLILTTQGFTDVQDLRFVLTHLMRALVVHLRQTVTRYNELRHVVVFEDAVDLLSADWDRATTMGVSPLAHMFTMLGRLGIAVFVCVQNLSQLSETVLSSAANMVVCGSFSDDRDLVKTTRSLGLETRL